jgi:hypothetical protein
MQAFVSGRPIFVTHEALVGLTGGLPTIIPGTLRSLIRSRDLTTIRAVLSVFAVYRIIQIPGKLKLSTITDPFKGLSMTLPKYEIDLALSELTFGKLSLKPIKLIKLGTAGPNHSVSILGIWKDIWAWKDSNLLGDLQTYCLSVPGGKEFFRLISSEIEFLERANYAPDKNFILGKLSEKNEAAGKIRVFAITDAITQSVLAPLSDGIFKILDSLPMDGTFDQDRPVRWLLKRINDKVIDGELLYSYDLSAATDRLPIKVQEQVLASLLSPKIASSWSKILTERDWYHNGVPLRYSVGQPMGALSSWAMLALTHHVLLRISAARVGLHEFKDYALLGDDIVIANVKVAESYHHLMVTVLGVDINLSKSLISGNSFEFAKRLITTEGEVSPVGAKNLLVGVKTLKGIPSVLLDLVNKGFFLSEDLVDNLYKSIPTVRKSQLERLSWLVKGPFGFIPTRDGLSASMKLNNSLSRGSVNRLLSNIDLAFYESNCSILNRNIKKVNDIITNLLKISQPEGFIVDIKLSPIYHHILDSYYKSLSTLMTEKPTLPNILSLPTKVIRCSWEEWPSAIMEHIRAKVISNEESVSPLDPFQDEKVILPLNHSIKSESFWLRVKELEEKSKKDWPDLV